VNYTAGAFSVLVHAVFMLALVFGVTWRSQPIGPAVAYLWDALPPMTRVAAASPEQAPVAPAPPRPAPPASREAKPVEPDIEIGRAHV
jgi:colicin import membrane protein